MHRRLSVPCLDVAESPVSLAWTAFTKCWEQLSDEEEEGLRLDMITGYSRPQWETFHLFLKEYFHHTVAELCGSTHRKRLLCCSEQHMEFGCIL